MTRLLPHISRHGLAFFEKLPPCLVGIEACASSHHLVTRAGTEPYRTVDADQIRVSAPRCGERRFSRLKSDFANKPFRTPIKTRSAFSCSIMLLMTCPPKPWPVGAFTGGPPVLSQRRMRRPSSRATLRL